MALRLKKLAAFARKELREAVLLLQEVQTLANDGACRGQLVHAARDLSAAVVLPASMATRVREACCACDGWAAVDWAACLT